MKTVDYPPSAEPNEDVISTTATFDLLNGVQEGSSFYNRIGRKIMLKSIHVTGAIVPQSTGGGVPEYDRIMLIYDRQPNGAFPTASDVLTDYDNTGTNRSTSFSGMNMNNSERFLILRDHRFQVPDNNSGAAVVNNPGSDAIVDNTGIANINWFVKLKNLETHYKASSNPAVIGDIATGSLFLFTFGSVPVATAGYQLQFKSRLRYHDI